MVEAEGEQLEGEDYVNESDPSILRFLLASREEVIIYHSPLTFLESLCDVSLTWNSGFKHSTTR